MFFGPTHSPITLTRGGGYVSLSYHSPEVPTGALPHTPVSLPTSDAASTPPFPPVVTAAAIILPTVSRFSIGSFYFAFLAGFTPLLHRVQSRANLLPSPRGSPELPKNAVINAMSPDLNSLPPSSPPSLPIRSRMSSSNGDSPMPHSVPASAGAPARGESPTGSPRRLSTSLQAAATMNAGLQHEPSRRKLARSSAWPFVTHLTWHLRLIERLALAKPTISWRRPPTIDCFDESATERSFSSRSW